MKIYIYDDNEDVITWVIKSKDVKHFLKEKDYITKDELSEYPINNLHQIACAMSMTGGKYCSEIYKKEQDNGN